MKRGPKSKRGQPQVRVNNFIRAPKVRIIDETGNMLGVLSSDEGTRLAKEKGLDLIEVSPNAEPPVCKIGDYGKYLYEKKKKQHTARKKQAVISVKEVQFRPRTEEHDLDFKFKHVERFLQDGDKAKIIVMFRGREIVYVENGHKLLKRLIDRVKEYAVVESPPKLEGKRLTMVLAPNTK